MDTKPKQCPKCGSENIKEIFYGLPREEFMESEEAKQYHFAGCTLWGNDPKWICRNLKCPYFLGGADRRKNRDKRKEYFWWEEASHYTWGNNE